MAIKVNPENVNNNFDERIDPASPIVKKIFLDSPIKLLESYRNITNINNENN